MFCKTLYLFTVIFVLLLQKISGDSVCSFDLLNLQNSINTTKNISSEFDKGNFEIIKQYTQEVINQMNYSSDHELKTTTLFLNVICRKNCPEIKPLVALLNTYIRKKLHHNIYLQYSIKVDMIDHSFLNINRLDKFPIVNKDNVINLIISEKENGCRVEFRNNIIHLQATNIFEYGCIQDLIENVRQLIGFEMLSANDIINCIVTEKNIKVFKNMNYQTFGCQSSKLVFNSNYLTEVDLMKTFNLKKYISENIEYANILSFIIYSNKTDGVFNNEDFQAYWGEWTKVSDSLEMRHCFRSIFQNDGCTGNFTNGLYFLFNKKFNINFDFIGQTDTIWIDVLHDNRTEIDYHRAFNIHDNKTIHEINKHDLYFKIAIRISKGVSISREEILNFVKKYQKSIQVIPQFNIILQLIYIQDDNIDVNRIFNKLDSNENICTTNKIIHINDETQPWLYDQRYFELIKNCPHTYKHKLVDLVIYLEQPNNQNYGSAYNFITGNNNYDHGFIIKIVYKQPNVMHTAIHEFGHILGFIHQKTYDGNCNIMDYWINPLGCNWLSVFTQFKSITCYKRLYQIPDYLLTYNILDETNKNVWNSWSDYRYLDNFLMIKYRTCKVNYCNGTFMKFKIINPPLIFQSHDELIVDPVYLNLLNIKLNKIKNTKVISAPKIIDLLLENFSKISTSIVTYNSNDFKRISVSDCRNSCRLYFQKDGLIYDLGSEINGVVFKENNHFKICIDGDEQDMYSPKGNPQFVFY